MSGAWRYGFTSARFSREMKGLTDGRAYGANFMRGAFRAGKERVRKLMKADGLRARGACKLKATTRTVRTHCRCRRNLLERKFDVEQPNRFWTGDISVPRQAA